jgi:AGCS family alanine or glycine:cation symporter
MGGSVLQLHMVWNFADIANGLMAVPNLISLLALQGVLVAETRHWLWQGRIDEFDDSNETAVETKS